MLGQVYNSDLAYILEQGFDTAGAEVTVALPNSKIALAGWIDEFETTFAAYIPLRADVDLYETTFADFFELTDLVDEYETTYANYIADPLTGEPVPTADEIDEYDGWVEALALEVGPTPEEITAYEADLAAIDALEDVPSETAYAQYLSWVDLYALFDGDEITCTFNELFTYAYGELYNVKDINYAGKTDDFDNITAALEGVLLDLMIAIPLFTTVGATVYNTRIVFEANEYHAWMGWGGLKYMYIGKAAE